MDPTVNKKLEITAFLLFLLGTAIVGNVAAQTETVSLGVSTGDTFKYDLTLGWSSSLPGEVPPVYLIEENQTDYYQISIQFAASTTAVLQTSWRFLNGTVVNGTALADVSGLDENITSSIYLYAANLTAGGKLFPLAADLPWVINDTTFRQYGGNFRATNHIEANRTDLEGELYSYLSLYFDQQTGMLVESNSIDVYTSAPTQVFTRHFILKESSVWVVPEFPGFIAVPLLMAAVGAGVLLFKKKYAAK
jgi:hypothetical protein